MEDHIKALFEGQELSEEFKSKVQTIFKSAIDEAVSEKEAELEAQFAEQKQEYEDYVIAEGEEKVQTYIDTVLVESVQSMLGYGVEEFIRENQEKIDGSVKSDIAESMIKSFASIAESYNVKLPEGGEDQIAAMQSKVDEAKTDLSKQIEQNARLNSQVVEMKREIIIGKELSGLSEAQKDRLVQFAENINYVDEKQFTSAVTQLKESYHPQTPDTTKQTQIDESVPAEGTQDKKPGSKSSLW